MIEMQHVSTQLEAIFRKITYKIKCEYYVSCIPHDTHTHIVRRTLSGVPLTQYDMLPQHQINIRN